MYQYVASIVLVNSLDLVDDIPVDYMHSVLEGVALLLRAWFKSENHREPYYLGRSICQIDNLLLKQRPPSECSWPARSIQRHVQYCTGRLVSSTAGCFFIPCHYCWIFL